MAALMQTPDAVGTQVGLPDLRIIKKPISGRPEIGAQFQLWIFSYTVLARSSKKWVSRVMLARCSLFAARGGLRAGWPTLRTSQQWCRRANAHVLIATASGIDGGEAGE